MASSGPVTNGHDDQTNNVDGSKKEIKQHWRPAASVLRDMLADKSQTIICPGVYDGLTTRIALKAGFQCLYMVSVPDLTPPASN